MELKALAKKLVDKACNETSSGSYIYCTYMNELKDVPCGQLLGLINHIADDDRLLDFPEVLWTPSGLCISLALGLDYCPNNTETEFDEWGE